MSKNVSWIMTEKDRALWLHVGRKRGMADAEILGFCESFFRAMQNTDPAVTVTMKQNPPGLRGTNVSNIGVGIDPSRGLEHDDAAFSAEEAALLAAVLLHYANGWAQMRGRHPDDPE